VPFGPFMLVGALVAVLAGQELAAAYLDSTGL
jgi:prepilin signal peptidase PulO-like enzyme (type II secretory pathway)